MVFREVRNGREYESHDHLEIREQRLNTENRTPAATAEVRVNNRRWGTAVLVDGQHLLTALHVLGTPVSHEGTTVVFPQTDSEFSVEIVDLGETSSADLAVLRVLNPVAGVLPKSIDVWPDDRLPDAVVVFGFPEEEEKSEGVWRQFTVLGPTVSGIRQLRWDEGKGTFPGHSGGPVTDVDTGQLVGILLAGSEEGHFDRFIAISQIAKIWPELRRPWRYAKKDPQSHSGRRARGQKSGAHDDFYGRTVALNAITAWLRGQPPGRPLVVVGQPGSGKSAVLAQAALKAERAGGRGLVYHARGSSLDDFIDAVAGFLGLSVQELEDLLDAKDQRDIAFTVMVDALDEAHSVRDARLIAGYITALSRLPTVHTVVATRPLAVGDRFGSSGILARLLVFKESELSLIDLDVAPYRDRRAIQAFVDATLTQRDAAYQGPPGCAWETYEACDDLRLGLSKIIAEHADPNFLVAWITSMALSQQAEALDYRDPAFEPNSMPSGLGDALDEYFESIDAAVRGLLAALAYARGSGISDDRWMKFTSALGYSASRDDIERFRDSPGADYLLQTESGDGDRAVRLFHQALVDQLRASNPRPDEQKIYESLSEDVGNSGGWSRADAYLTTNIADHALACGQLANVLEDCEYIAVADITALVSALDTLGPQECPEIGHLILQEGPRLRDLGRNERLWLLAISATHAGKLAIRDKLLSARAPALFPDWAHLLGSSHQKLIGHKGPVHALAIGRLGRTDVIVSGGTDKTIRVWDHRGNSLGDPLEGHNNNVTVLTVGVVDGNDVIISGSADGTVRVWNQNGPVGPPFIGHTEPVSAVQIIKFEGQDAVIQDAVVSAAPRGEIIVWNSDGRVLRKFVLDSPLAAIGRLGGKPSIVAVGYRNLSLFSPVDGNLCSVPVEHTGKTALAIGRLGNTDVVVCGLENASIVVWRADGSSARDPLLGHERPAKSIAVGRLGGTDVVVSGSQDNSLVIWDFKGRVYAEPWTGHAGIANAVTTGPLKGRDIVACAGSDHIVRIWDNRTLRSRGRTNRRGQIRALGAGMIAGSFRIVTASGSGIELWDVDGKEVNEPSADHDADIRAIAIGQLSRGDAIVSASMDRKIHIWDSEGHPSGEPIVVRGKRITAVAIGRHRGQSVIASASLDKTIRIWDENGTEVDRLAAFGRNGARALSFGRFGGRDSLVVAGSDNHVRVWDLLDRKWAHRSPGASLGSVACFTLCTIDGCDIIAVGGSDGRIRTWQAGQKGYRVSQERHAARVNALAFLDVVGSPALVSAGADGILRVWSDMRRSDMFPLSESATRIAIAGSRIVIASGPALSMLRYSTPSGRESLDKSKDDSFTSTSELVVEGSGDLTAVEGSIRHIRHIRYVRTLLELGDADEAVAQLLPQLAHVPDAVRLAADAACGSGQESLIETVMPYLEDARMRGQPSVQGRLFALAVVVDRLDAARAASRAVGASLDTGAMGMIQLLDGDPEREWFVYRRSALALREGSFDDEFNFAHYIADVAAMRLLAVCRRGAGENVDLFVQRRDSLLEEYWGWFDDEVEERLAAMLSAYVASAEYHARLLPYQMISVYEALRSIAQENLGLRDQLVETLAQSLRPERSKVRSAFAAWAEYSDLAAAVVKRLAELDPAR